MTVCKHCGHPIKTEYGITNHIETICYGGESETRIISKICRRCDCPNPEPKGE